MMTKNSIEINKLNEFAIEKYTKNNNNVEIIKTIIEFNIIKRISNKKFIRIKI